MVGQAVTVVRVRETIGAVTRRMERETFTVRGTVLTVTNDEDGDVIGIEVDGTRVETGERRRCWYAVGLNALRGSLLVSQTATLDACGHPVTYGCDCGTIAAEASQGDDDCDGGDPWEAALMNVRLPMPTGLSGERMVVRHIQTCATGGRDCVVCETS